MTKTAEEAAQEKATFEAKIRKFPDFNALIQAAEAGALGSSGSVASILTVDFTENDENSREAKAAAEMLKIMARFFALKHDDALKTYGGNNDADAEDAFIDIDDMRSELIDKIWEYHEAVTTRWFPGESAREKRHRRTAGSRVSNITKKFIITRQAILSEHNQGDPLFAAAPPSQSEFSNALRRMSQRASELAKGFISGVMSPGKNKNNPPSAANLGNHGETAGVKNNNVEEDEQPTKALDNADAPTGNDARKVENGKDGAKGENAETDDEAEMEKRKDGEKKAAEWVSHQQQQPDYDASHIDAVNNIKDTSESHAAAIEKDNEYNSEILRKEEAENKRLREELKSLEAIQEMQRQKQREKKRRRKEQENVKTIQAKNHEMINKIEKIRREINEANESADEDDDDAVLSIENDANNAAIPTGSGQKRRHSQNKKLPNTVGDQASPAAPPAPIPALLARISAPPAPFQPNFSKLIHSLEIDAVRRNVVGVRPKEPFQKYDSKKKGQYNTLMNSFDSAFGCVEGISGNEKVTELAGHWFAGAAKKAINAAKPTVNDPYGHVAYAKVRTHLDSIYGQNVDSAAEALANLKEGA